MQYKAYMYTIVVAQILKWIHIMALVLILLSFIFIYIMENNAFVVYSIFMSVYLLVFLIESILFYYIVKGLIAYRSWARYLTMFMGVVMLVGFPIGTAIGILFIYSTTKAYPDATFKYEKKK